MSVRVVHFTDPGCPWAYSAQPFLRSLEWRFGDAIEWRHAMIGLTEPGDPQHAEVAEPGQWVGLAQRFRDRYGMPFAVDPDRPASATGVACRLVKAAELQSVDVRDRLLKTLRLAFFTTTLSLEEESALRAVASGPHLTGAGLDVDALFADLRTDGVEAAYQRDRAEAREAAVTGRPAVAQGKAAASGSGSRFTAPSLIVEGPGGTLVAGGFQPLAVYDAVLANADPSLERREPPEPLELLHAYLGGLTTQEVAQVVAGNDEPDRPEAELALARLEADGDVERLAAGTDAVWRSR